MGFQENRFSNINLMNLCRLKRYLFLLILSITYNQINCDDPPQPGMSILFITKLFTL